ncbi:hypothetical protein ACWKWC_00520 [Geodermatophilus nigrescens]
MLRVYLDQNKWVDLARAATGHSEGVRFRDALEICRATAASGTVSFPLDLYRYWETAKRGDDVSRNRLVDVMLELSRGHTLALPFPILNEEIDRALHRRFARPSDARRARPFGRGLRHIAGGRMEWPALEVPEGTPPGFTAQLQAELNGVLEDLRDIYPAVVEALLRAGLDPEDFPGLLGARGLLEFVDDLPTRYVTNVLRRAKHVQLQQPWEPNDFIDIVALPVPAVYCDIVVTEKQWVHHLWLGKVEERFDTQLLSDTAKLTDVLVAASALPVGDH